MTREASALRAGAPVVWAGLFIAMVRPCFGAVCTGDCNGNGVVSAGEVTTIIARVLTCNGIPVGLCGTTNAPDCASADKNGNGIISAGELTSAVVNALTGCPPEETPTPQPTAPQTTTPPPPTATASMTPEPQAPTATGTNTTGTSPPTVTRTPTATPAATPTTHPAVCNNGVLEDGETCAKCAMDCKVKACTPTTSVVTYYVAFSPPLGEDATSVTALLGYRSDRVSIPGSGTGSCKGGSKDGKACSTATDCPSGQCVVPKGSVKNAPPASIVGVNDLDYALRVVVTRTTRITPGTIFSVDFNTCQGAAATSLADFGCSVQGCASSFGPIDGCTCTVTQ